MPRTNEPGRSVSSRVLSVMFAFLPDRRSLSLSEIARSTGLATSTTGRLVRELVESGALEQSPNGRFVVGLKLWRLGTLAPRTESLRSLAQPVLEDLHAAIHQHAQLAVLEGDEAVVIERQSAPDAVRLVSRVGGRMPLHCSAVGKILLAYGGPERIDRYLSSELRQFTARTVVDPTALRAEIATIRKTGIATVRQELTPGAESVATYIADRSGAVVGALAGVVRAGSVDLQAVAPSVVASGLRLSRLLGWKPGVLIQTGDPLNGPDD